MGWSPCISDAGTTKPSEQRFSSTVPAQPLRAGRVMTLWRHNTWDKPQHVQPASPWGTRNARETFSITSASCPQTGQWSLPWAQKVTVLPDTMRWTLKLVPPFSPGFFLLLLTQGLTSCLLPVIKCQTPCLAYLNIRCSLDTLAKRSSQIHSPAYRFNHLESQTPPLLSASSKGTGVLTPHPQSRPRPLPLC